MSTRRKHFYMGTAMVQFSKDGKPYTHHTNFIIQTDEKKITAGVLQDANIMVAQTAAQELTLGQGDLKNIVFLTWTHLGLMSEREFSGTKSASDFTLVN